MTSGGDTDGNNVRIPRAKFWKQSLILVLALAVVLSGGVTVAGLATTSGNAAETVRSADSVVESIDATASAAGPSDTRQDLPTGFVQLNDSQTQFNGEMQGDRFGWSVTSVGDVNGDGVDDILMGAPGRNGTGAAYLFYGPVDESNVSAQDADLTLVGEDAGDRAGWAVAGDDIDNDGYADLVIGAPHNDDEAENAGAVYVVRGGDSLTGTLSLESADATLRGQRANERAGFSVATRNVTADRSGLLVGAPGTGTDSGAAYAVAAESLPQNGDHMSLSGSDLTVVGEADGDRAGWSVAWVGDVTGDDTANALIGARNHTAGDENQAGAAYVIRADASGTTELESSAGKIVGDGPNDSAGFAVAAAGDVDGDGVGDVIIGAPFNDTRADDAGATYVLYGGDDLT
ncbi:MAG: integrin alpha, partial [Haloarculaceae archaeon]